MDGRSKRRPYGGNLTAGEPFDRSEENADPSPLKRVRDDNAVDSARLADGGAFWDSYRGEPVVAIVLFAAS